MSLEYILMGDIIASSGYQAPSLREAFLAQIEACNHALETEIASPYTVTLGDEFQGVATSRRATLEAIFYLEEHLLRGGLPFRLRYVAVHGEIETPLNRQKAHTMMGAGLTRARQMLTDKRRGQPRFRFNFRDEATTQQFERLFTVLDGLTERWSPADAVLICDMITNRHNAEVGQRHGKDRSQIWKRRRHLLIEEYRALKAVILDLAA